MQQAINWLYFFQASGFDIKTVCIKYQSLNIRWKSVNETDLKMRVKMALNRSPEFHCLIVQIVCVVVI